MLNPGDILPNGWTVISYTGTDTGGRVLAMMPGKQYEPFATWTVNPADGDTYHGHYFGDILEAAAHLAGAKSINW
jgi:hypothetical protein